MVVMNETNLEHTGNFTPPRNILPVLQKLKSAYLVWHEYHQILPKAHRYSLGQKTDNLLAETIEAIVTAAFLQKQEKLPRWYFNSC